MVGLERGSSGSWAEKLAEISKKIDYVFIGIGSGIYILINKVVGAAIIVGSALTIIPAEVIKNWAKKRRAKAVA